MPILRLKDETGNVFDVPALIGPRGEKGESGVYVGYRRGLHRKLRTPMNEKGTAPGRKDTPLPPPAGPCSKGLRRR